ncbi:glutamate receptor ionotropic, delta-2 isoform X2 [Halyomorpha halys]|uniref:glutamate receptor ionotropic, delta-2 isoform X2 n=1 Tax=Halyomorpha halys TaxID=286706 RepID=UPI0006D4C867|nr:uncharacterized protein LOC106691745 isoform X2 [Halyomorpha halys]
MIDPPFVIVKSYLNGSKYADGYLIDLWNCITERLDLSFEIKYFPTMEGGDFWNFANNGLRVEMERSEMDVALYASADPVDIYSNYTGVHTGVHLRLCTYEHKKRINFYQFIKTINSSCFAVLTFIGVLSAFLMYIAGNNLADSFLYFLAISFNQGPGEEPPTTSSVRIVIISFSISVLVFFYVSSASMASLSVNNQDLESTTIEEVVDHSYIRRSIIVEYTSAHVMMRYSDLATTFDKLRRVKMAKLPSVRDALTVTSKLKWFSFIERERVWPYWEEFKCCVFESDLRIVRPTHFMVRRNLSITQVFRQESARLMENGVVSLLIKKWWPIVDASRKEFIPISLADVSIIFDLFAFGALVSLLIFFIERHVGILFH